MRALFCGFLHSCALLFTSCPPTKIRATVASCPAPAPDVEETDQISMGRKMSQKICAAVFPLTPPSGSPFTVTGYIQSLVLYPQSFGFYSTILSLKFGSVSRMRKEDRKVLTQAGWAVQGGACLDGKQPKPGDLIEIFRVTYQHWAVYIGEGNVVHLVTSEGASDVSTMPHKDQKGTVRKEKLKDVVGDSKWRINNYLDKERPPRCNNDIVKAACSLVDSELSYNPLSYNCKHFATEMRNGRVVSRQFA
nr:phospholipase A and acyltransferase 5-like [Nothobranchius furzeri]